MPDVVLGHENCSQFMGVHYELEFLNKGHNEFGTDEDGLLGVYCWFTVSDRQNVLLRSTDMASDRSQNICAPRRTDMASDRKEAFK